VTVTVTDDGTGTLTDSETFTITVNDVNSAPVLASIGDRNVDENATLTFTATATDSDDPSDTLSYSLDAASLARGMSIDSSTGMFSWTPTESQGGTTHSVTITVTEDGAGTPSDSETFMVMVGDVNEAPVITSDGGGVAATVTVDENQTGVITVSATDADDNATWTYSLVGGADRAAFAIDASTGELTFLSAPDHETKDSYEVEVAVTDDGALSDSQVLTVTVEDVDEVPVARDDTLETDEDVPRVIDVATELLENDQDPEGVTLRLVDATAPAHGTLVLAADGTLEYHPDADFNGTDRFEYLVEDGSGQRATASVIIEVAPVNDPPVIAPSRPDNPVSRPGVIDGPAITLGSMALDENSTVDLRVEATDVDGEQVWFALGGADAALFDIDPETGELWSLAPLDFESPRDEDGDNRYDLEFLLFDGTGDISRVAFVIVASDVNEAPSAVDERFAVPEGYVGTVGQLNATDPDSGDRLVFQLLGAGNDGGSSGLSLFPDGRLHAADLLVGTHTFDVRVVDASGLFSDGRLIVTVEAADADTGEPSLGPATPTTPVSMAESVSHEIESVEEPPGDTGLPVPDDESAHTSAQLAMPVRLVEESIGLRFDSFDATPEEESNGTNREPADEASVTRASGGMREHVSVLPPLDSRLPVAVSAQLHDAIELLRSGMDELESQAAARQNLVLAITTATGATFSIGAALWLLQSRLLLATALAAMPLWRPIDPLPILIFGDKRPDEGDDGHPDGAQGGLPGVEASGRDAGGSH